MLYRKVESIIRNWITNDKRALLVDGARQVGKTFTIREVLKTQNCEYIEFNLLENPSIINLLAKCESVDEMILVVFLSLQTNEPPRGKPRGIRPSLYFDFGYTSPKSSSSCPSYNFLYSSTSFPWFLLYFSIVSRLAYIPTVFA